MALVPLPRLWQHPTVLNHRVVQHTDGALYTLTHGGPTAWAERTLYTGEPSTLRTPMELYFLWGTGYPPPGTRPHGKPTTERLIRVQISITSSEIDSVKAAAGAAGTSLSDWCRQAIRAALKTQ